MLQHKFNYRFNFLSYTHTDTIHPIVNEHYFVSFISAMANNYHIVIAGEEAMGKQ